MRKIIIALLVCFMMPNPCRAMEWKALHEAAGRTSLKEALSAVQGNPDAPDNLYILGLVYLNLHKDREAGEVFSRIIAKEPKIYEARWGLAECWRRQHKLEQSGRVLNEIIKSAPGFLPAYISLAYIKYIQMDFEHSVILSLRVIRAGRGRADLSNYVRALTLYAGAKGMIAHYGRALSRVVNGTVVLPNLRKAEKLQPDAAGVLFGLGSFYLLAPAIAGGDPAKAEGYLKRAIAADPLFADAYVRLGQFYKIKGDNQRFQTYLQRALEIDPENELAGDVKSGKCRFICTGDNS